MSCCNRINKNIYKELRLKIYIYIYNNINQKYKL